MPTLGGAGFLRPHWWNLGQVRFWTLKVHALNMLLSLWPRVVEIITGSVHFFPLDSSVLEILLIFCRLRMECQLLWQWFKTGLWIMDFFWIVGLDISSSFQFFRQLHRGGLNFFLLGFELNAHVSCINLGSKKVLEISSEMSLHYFRGGAMWELLWARLLDRLLSWYIKTIRRAGSVNCSSEVMPWWYPRA